MVTVEHCKEVGITNSVAAFTSPRQTSFRRDIMVSNKNMCWEYGFLFNLLSDDRCCQQAWLSSHCSCCQPSVMVGTCCLQSSSIVLMMPWSNRRRISFFLSC